MFSEPTHVAPIVDDYLHDLLSPVNATYVERHCQHCTSCAAALTEARKRLAALQSVPCSEPPERLIRATADKVLADVKKDRRFRRIAILGGLGSMAAGLLILITATIYYSNLSANAYNLAILGQNRLLAGSLSAFHVRLTDGNRAVAGVPVCLELLDKQGKRHALGQFTTDKEGTAGAQVGMPDWADGDYDLRVIAKTPYGDEELKQSVRLTRSWRLMLTSDKPVYQPGQTIQLRSLGLRRPDLKPVAGETAVFTVTDPKDNVIFKETGPTSAYGIASAKCPLASEILEGAYTIGCKVGDTESKMRVEVKKYVLPKFKVVVEFDKPFYQPGEMVHGKVRADYFFGQPVARGEVAVEMATDLLPGSKPTKFSTQSEKDGVATFGFRLPEHLIGKEIDGGQARAQFAVTVTDTAGQKQSVASSRVVTTQPLHIDILPESGKLVEGLLNQVYVMVTTPDGQPAAQARLAITGVDHELKTNGLGIASFMLMLPTGQVNLPITVQATAANGDTARQQALLASDQINRDFLLRTNKAVYRTGDSMHITVLGGSSEPVFLDLIRDGQTVATHTINLVNGTGNLDFDIPADLFGTFELCGYRLGNDDLVVRKTRAVYVRSANDVNIKAALDRKEYQPGKQAKLDLTLTDAQGKPVVGAISLSAVDEAVFAVLEQRPGMEKTFYTLEQQLLEPVYAIYPWSPWSGDGSDESVQLEQALFSCTVHSCVEQQPVVVPTNGKFPFQGGANARPMMPAPVTNNPHTLSVASLPRKIVAIEERREWGLKMVDYGWWFFGGIMLTGIVCSAGAGVVKVARRFHMQWKETRRQDIPPEPMGGGWGGLLVLGCCLIVLGLFAISVLGGNANKTFSNVAFALGGGGGWGPQAVRSAPMVAQAPASEPPIAVVFKTPPTAPNPAKPASPPVRVREWFPETLLWRPEIITDEHGHSSVDISLADSITSWRLSASAVTADGRLGAAQEPIRVFQPFFVDLNLPVTLTRRDEVSVPAVVYNYLDQPQTVTLTLADAPWFERLDDNATLELKLAPREVKSVSFQLRARKVGSFPLEVTARGQDGVADALRKEIEVVPDGQKVERVVNGSLQQPVDLTLTVPQAAIEGSPKLLVKLYPSNFSQLVEGLDGIFQMPYGCFEQTSSTTYPNVLALDYLRRTKKSAPEVEAKARQYIHLGYQRLLGFEVQGGGFEWFGNPPALTTMTAYGVMEFQDMAKVHDVDPNLIRRTREWLLRRRNTNGSWSPEERRLHSLGDPTRGLAGTAMATYSTTAFVAWAVYGGQPADEGGMPTLNYLLSVKPDQINDPYVLAVTCNALQALAPNHTAATPYLDRLDAIKKTSSDGKRAWWEQDVGQYTAFYGTGQSGNVETTALAALALLPSGGHGGSVRGALTWLAEQKDARGTWHSTQATVLALRALLAGTTANLGEAKERRFEITLGNTKRQITIPADQDEVMKQIDLSSLLQGGDHHLTVRELSDTGAGYQVMFRYYEPGDPALAKKGPLTIDLNYDRTELAVNDVLKVQATVRNTTTTAAPMVVLDLPVPAGFALNTDSLAKLRDAGKIAKFQVTARQAIVYLRGVEAGQTLELSYELRATMPVKVTAPAARAYQYYDPSKEGFSPPRQLTVEARR
jgi:uncharacterized protein YfaS (alpha-2-macroglobulin family)